MTGHRLGRVHAVLGMHRSGTSWLAGSLEERGLAFGDVNEAAPYNAKGTRENDALQAIHVGVLRDSGGSWRDPPRKITWSEARRSALRDFIAEMTAVHGRWGFKDPRTLLLLDEWVRAVPDLEVVGIYRHPEAVARSLAKREFSPVDRDRAVRLWRVYNARLVELHKRRPFPIVRFDVAQDELAKELEFVADAWGATAAAGTEHAFFEEELVHENPVAGAKVPRSCRRIWRYLEEQRVKVS